MYVWMCLCMYSNLDTCVSISTHSVYFPPIYLPTHSSTYLSPSPTDLTSSPIPTPILHPNSILFISRTNKRRFKWSFSLRCDSCEMAALTLFVRYVSTSLYDKLKRENTIQWARIKHIGMKVKEKRKIKILQSQSKSKLTFNESVTAEWHVTRF